MSDADATTAVPAAEGGQASATASTARSWPERWDSPRNRVVVLAVLACLAVTITRSLMIVEGTVQTFDEPYHLAHGLALLNGRFHESDAVTGFNDPPLGAAIVAMPLWVRGATSDAPREAGYAVHEHWGWWPVLYGQERSPDTLRAWVAVWKCILMVPGLMAAWGWAWLLFGPRAAWLTLGLLLVEPTLAAHLPLATVDTLGLSAILFGAYLAWRLSEHPTWPRLIGASAACAVAVLCKHTALVLPLYALIILVFGLRFHVGWRFLERPGAYAGRIAAAVALVLLFMWAFTGFEISPPIKAQFLEKGGTKLVDWQTAEAEPWLKTPLPAGTYIGSFTMGLFHVETGHRGFLWGQTRGEGWWYYLPVIAVYKVPIGHGIVLLLGVVSLLWRRPRMGEFSLLLAIGLWGGLMLFQGVSIGFRHALPTYAFLVIAASRLTATSWRWPTVLACIAVAGSFVHTLKYHPNYLPYLNAPWEKPWLVMSDSNLDWGQSAKQIRQWVMENHEELPKPVYISTWSEASRAGERELLHFPPEVKAKGIKWDMDLPESGTLVISPVKVAGVYEPTDRFKPLWEVEPIEVISHSILVYDLEQVPREPADVVHNGAE